MIFCQYQYREFHNGNKADWPIQPPTSDAWCKMVNDNREYCKTAHGDDVSNVTGLPSFHPHWSMQVAADLQKYADMIQAKFNRCVADPSLIGSEFRRNYNLKDATAEIQRLREKASKLIIAP